MKRFEKMFCFGFISDRCFELLRRFAHGLFTLILSFHKRLLVEFGQRSMTIIRVYWWLWNSATVD